MSYLSKSIGATKPPKGAPIDWGHPLSNGLVAAYLANELSGSAIRDLVHGDQISFASTVPYWESGRVVFDGTSTSFATSNTPPAFQLTNGPFTVVISTTDPQFTNNGAHVSLGSSNSSNNLLHVRTPTSTSVLFGLFSNDLTVTVPDMTGKTCHIVCTLDSTFKQTVYLNGVYAGERNSGAFGGFLDLLCLSKFGSNASYSGQKFDHLLLYNRALTVTEVARLYAGQYDFFSPVRPWSLYLPASGGITGTSAVTAPAATLTASGTIVNAYTGTSAVTAAAATMAATGTVVNPASGFNSNFQLLGIG